jgi:uncharacterized MAPEG superfamily protein
MTIAYWCVLAMILLPYVFTVIAKWSPFFDNHYPRDYLANTTGWRKRANCVQLNFFESTPAFGIAVIIASIVHAPQNRIDVLALTFVVCRIIYSICYLTDKASLRSLFWFLGLLSVVALFIVSALA